MSYIDMYVVVLRIDGVHVHVHTIYALRMRVMLLHARFPSGNIRQHWNDEYIISMAPEQG